MAYGISVLSDAQSIQIDGRNPNLSLVQKSVWYPVAGTGTTNATANVAYQSTSISYTSTGYPQLAIRASNAYCGVWGVVKSGNTWTWEVYSIHAEVSPSVECYVFDRVVGRNRNSGFGMEVYGGDGSLIGSDAYAMMRIVNVSGAYDGSVTLDPNGKYAYAGVGPWWRNRIEERGDSLSQQPEYFRLSWIGGIKWIGGTPAYLDHTAEGTGKTYGWDNSSGEPYLLTVDVTNL